MVNNPMHGHPNPFVRQRNELPWPPPSSEPGQEESRVIPFQVWQLTDIQTIAQKYLDGEDSLIHQATPRCLDDMQKEKLELGDVARLLLRLESDDYLNSRWCMAGSRPGVKMRPDALWLPCDAYCLLVETENESGTCVEKKYYIKVCRTATGTMLLIVSMHPSIF